MNEKFEEYQKAIGSVKNMKIGDIILNKWAGHIDFQYNILIEKRENNLKLLSYDERVGGWKVGTCTVEKLFFDGTPAYVVVGHSNFINVAKNDLQKIKVAFKELKKGEK